MPDASELEIVLAAGGYGAPRFTGLVRPAVLIVDMTNDFGHPDGVYPRHGAVCEALPGAVAAARDILQAAAASDVPTISASQVIFADPHGHSVAGGGLVDGRPWLAREGFRPGSWGVQLVDELPRTDYSIEKPRASAFFGTPLEVLLRGLDVRTLIVAGCFTNQCVDATVRDAWARDLQVVVVTDAVAAFDPRLHEAALESLRPQSTQLTARELVGMLDPVRVPSGQPVEPGS